MKTAMIQPMNLLATRGGGSPFRTEAIRTAHGPIPSTWSVWHEKKVGQATEGHQSHFIVLTLVPLMA